MLRLLFRLARALVVAWIGLILLVAVFQRSFIYFPTIASEKALEGEAQRQGLEAWRNTAGETIGWRRPPASTPRATNRLLVFHGNAGYALNRCYYVSGFGDLEGGRTWEIYLLEYPGYGARGGSPSEKSINTAAAAALTTLREEDSRPIFVLGESFGSGPACALAAAYPREVSGVFLVTPFARLGDVAAHHYSLLPVRYLLRDRWDNVAALTNYPGRVAARIAGDDEVVTASQGWLLMDGFRGPKRSWVVRGARHNDVVVAGKEPWWREVSNFLLAAP